MSTAALDIARVVAVGNEADVFAFGLLGVSKALFGGYEAHVALFIQALSLIHISAKNNGRMRQGTGPFVALINIGEGTAISAAPFWSFKR